MTSSSPRGWTISERIGVGHADLLERQELARDPPEHHADGALLLEDGDAEADAVGEFDGEVGPALFLQLLLAAVGRDRLHQGGGVVGVEHLGVELAQPAVHGGSTGGWPTEMCRSLALSWMTVVSSLSIRTCPVDTGSASLRTTDRGTRRTDCTAAPVETARLE